jgi:hypothetical protein
VVVAGNEIEAVFGSGVDGRGCLVLGFGAGEVSALDWIFLDGFDGVFDGVVAGVTLSAGFP